MSESSKLTSHSKSDIDIVPCILCAIFADGVVCSVGYGVEDKVEIIVSVFLPWSLEVLAEKLVFRYPDRMACN